MKNLLWVASLVLMFTASASNAAAYTYTFTQNKDSHVPIYFMPEFFNEIGNDHNNVAHHWSTDASEWIIDPADKGSSHVTNTGTPDPSAALIFGLGLIALAAVRRKRD